MLSKYQDNVTEWYIRSGQLFGLPMGKYCKVAISVHSQVAVQTDIAIYVAST